MIRRRPGLLRRGRPAIAFVSPFPPVWSGVAGYSYRLVAELVRSVDVACFTDQDLATCRVPPGATVAPITVLHAPALAGAFDRVLYVLGNNSYHTGAIRALRCTPGAVHLHDVRLEFCYTDPADAAGVDPTPFHLGDVARHATAILTNSEHAAELVRTDVGRAATVVGPLAVPSRPNAPRARNLVASFGAVSETKQSAKVLDAFTTLRERHPELEFAFVGWAPEGFGAEGITVTGYATDDDFTAALDRTLVAVQLRETTNGESSGAVADAIAAGAAVVVTDFAAQAELPNDAVHKVPRTISAAELADVVDERIVDERRRTAMIVAGRRYAATNDTAAAARRLLDALAVDPVARSAGVRRRDRFW